MIIIIKRIRTIITIMIFIIKIIFIMFMGKLNIFVGKFTDN